VLQVRALTGRVQVVDTRGDSMVGFTVDEGEGIVRRLSLVLAVGAVGAFVPSAATAAPPSPPPGCNVVVTTPAAQTGSDRGLEQKAATFDRVCLGG
jgi:hypothetical protein